MTSITVAADPVANEVAEERDIALPFRGDTFLGVFEAIGQDLGIHPNFLRVPFAALILWNPVVIVGSYLGLGAVVAITRWFFPVGTPASEARGEKKPGGETASAKEECGSEELLAA